MKKSGFIKEVTWSDVRLEVAKIAPDIFAAIERLNPDDSYTLYKVGYPYGAKILGENGVCYLPTENGLLAPLSSDLFSKKIHNDLAYNWSSLPMGLILSGEVELFIEETKEHIETYNIHAVGTMLAARAVLDPSVSYHARHFWKMTSGVRSVFMLPSISDRVSFNRLKEEFNLRIDKPQSHHDHWKLFVSLAEHPMFPNPWQSEILFFSKKWLETRDDDVWRLFRLTLLERSWAMSSYVRNKGLVDRIWHYFLNKLRNKKATNYVTNMAWHLIEAGLGKTMVYVPDSGTNKGGPFNEIRNIFLNVYSLKKYAPIIMLPSYFNMNSSLAGYVSIQQPGSHISKKHSSDCLIADTREIKYVLNQFISKIVEDGERVADTPLYDLCNLDYQFYHADKDKHGELNLVSEIFNNEPVMQEWIDHSVNNQLAFRNDFMRSCVKIVPRKTKLHPNEGGKS